MNAVHERVETDLQLGETVVTLQRHGAADAPLLLFNLHANESSAAAAGRRVLRHCNGRLYAFVDRGTRRLEFQCGTDPVEIDPNRIFSTRGIAQALVRFNAHVPPQAHEAVSSFAVRLLEILHLDTARTVVALHNTGDHYSVHSYERGGEHAGDAADVHIDPTQHRHDFFFVTDVRHFEALRRRKFNVVLQHPRAATDDGSLSVYCAQRGIPYVNVEGRYGAVAYQTEMLRQLCEVLAGTGL